MNLALSGKMAAGKSTILQELAKHHSFQALSIGSVIKPLATQLIEDKPSFILSLKQALGESEQVMSTIGNVLEFFDLTFQKVEWVKDEAGQFIKTPAYRRLLQEFPTILRRAFGNAIFLEILLSQKQEELCRDQSFVVDDLRLPEEMELLKKYGFLIVRLDISPAEQKQRLLATYGAYEEKALVHPTETALDEKVFDLRIDVSTLSPEQSAKQIEQFLRTKKEVGVV